MEPDPYNYDRRYTEADAIAETVRALDAIDADDPERAHSEVDRILMQNVPSEIAEAARRVQSRAPWWASA